MVQGSAPRAAGEVMPRQRPADAAPRSSSKGANPLKNAYGLQGFPCDEDGLQLVDRS